MSVKKIKRKRKTTKRTPTPATKLKGIIKAKHTPPKAKNILDKEVSLNNPIIKALEYSNYSNEIHILLLPSTNSFEAFGLVQLEAMNFGKLVIASDISGVRVPIVA